jgi:hypothetical protein
MKWLAHVLASPAIIGPALGLTVGLALTVELWRLGVEWMGGAIIAAP